MVNVDALRRAVRDLAKNFPTEYTDGRDYLSTIDSIARRLPRIEDALSRRDIRALKTAEDIIAFQHEALLANPLLDFDRLLLIKRKPLGDPRRSHEPVRGIGQFVGMPQQSSWQLHTMKNTDGWDNEICVLSPVLTDGRITTVYRPSKGRLISEMDLHFDAEKVMFSPDLVPRDARFDDEELVATNVGAYLPNPWGLHDMHGNVWEWTRSTYRPYPYESGDGRNDVADAGSKVVRGGSWYDRPKRCRSAFRLSYPAWRKVYNVGFRIVIEPDAATRRFVKETHFCLKTRSGFERLIFRLAASGSIDDKTNIACFAVFARRKIARSRADDGVFRQSLVHHSAFHPVKSF